ncbi:hypothetical protein [Maridesulfovibrio sp.]|uniref:hypothetical protein n=1 Tax=Maridesulfovibrio sp. TaxID=2795000 RepID=UPI002A18B306|nr:hypothetical protein [Maridesulfovibrio sp.]
MKMAISDGKAFRFTVHTAVCILALLIITGCSGRKGPGQPVVIPFDSDFITTNRTLSVSPALKTDGSSDRSFLSITQQTYFFENKNATARVMVLLNRKADVQIPEIGQWSTVSTGNCLSKEDDVKCFTAHIDCHLVRTTFIRTGERSLAVIKVRNRAREPQELCEQWEFDNLSPDQEAMVEDFNTTSDSYFSYR